MSLDTPFTETADQPIVIRNSKWKLFLMSLASLAFVLGGLWMMRSSQSSRVYYEGLATLIFFGLGLLVFPLQMFTTSLLLKIDREGIHCFYPFWRPLTIRWEEISSIYPIKMRFTTILTITVSLTGKPTYLARNFKPSKIPFTLRKADGPATAISLPLSTATLSSTKAIALIRERYAAQIGHYRISIQEKQSF
ncbi:MAG TPA: STM3941 family protein [Ktedonobacteraceae bacterium]|nr:STM3941 family protein [Ktedonobacteraceae bacterium]